LFLGKFVNTPAKVRKSLGYPRVFSPQGRKGWESTVCTVEVAKGMPYRLL
jgi:hypothetical protein